MVSEPSLGVFYQFRSVGAHVMKTRVIATLPTGRASFTFTGPDWVLQARERWPDATLYEGTPLCRVCELSAAQHGAHPSGLVRWCE